jgi:deoxycytidylate deaminase
VGWNDVPRFGGGLYSEDDQSIFDEKEKAVVDRDRRCFKWGGCICHNEVRRNGIIDNISARVASSKLVKKGTTSSQIRDILSGTEIDSITEYSRSIHAEMEAILSVAREGKHSLVGASLYTNTYPCHNCARHIVAAGISKVYYIEPYLKSLAIELHDDAVTEDSDEEGKVVFQQYDGVAPKNYLRLFRPSADRKHLGRLSRQPKKVALPTFRVALDSQADYEAKVIADLSEAEQVSAS